MAESRRRSVSPPLSPDGEDQVPLVSAQRLEDDPRGLKRKEPPPRPTFKVVGHLVLAMQRFKASLNPTYTYGKQHSQGSENGESSNGVRSDHRRSSSEGSQLEVEKKLPHYAYSGRGHKADYLFKHLPNPEESVQDSKDGAAALYKPYKHGILNLSHRLVYAPLTRCRAPEQIPLDIHVQYYVQRASKGGLIISEGTVISPTASGYPNVPGIWTEEQIAGWRKVTDAVHAKGATIFMQIWHVGRASTYCYQPDGAAPIAPSAIAVPAGPVQVFNFKTGKPEDYPTPRALDITEIPDIVNEYRRGARNAIAAGFDGVEIHGANGYLINQFLTESSNTRTDKYGGSVENRCRFALEVVRAVSEEIGVERTGIRLAPFNKFLGASTTDPEGLYTHLIGELAAIGDLAYIHLVEPRVAGNVDVETEDSIAPFRAAWSGTLIAAGGFKRASAAEAIATGQADLVAVGRHFLSNPDLPKRWALDAPLNKYNRDTFYTPGLEGYLDYPYLEDTQVGKEFLASLAA